MKLLYCQDCNHLFSLSVMKLRSCDCGKVKGMYVGPENAEVNGEGVSVAIGNGSLLNAIRTMEKLKFYVEEDIATDSRELFLEEANIEYAWVRPHQGLGNPHTKINRRVGEKTTKEEAGNGPVPEV